MAAAIVTFSAVPALSERMSYRINSRPASGFATTPVTAQSRSHFSPEEALCMDGAIFVFALSLLSFCCQRAAGPRLQYRNPRWPRRIRFRDQRVRPGDGRIRPADRQRHFSQPPLPLHKWSPARPRIDNRTNFATGRALDSQGQVVGDLEIDDSFAVRFCV